MRAGLSGGVWVGTSFLGYQSSERGAKRCCQGTCASARVSTNHWLLLRQWARLKAPSCMRREARLCRFVQPGSWQWRVGARGREFHTPTLPARLTYPMRPACPLPPSRVVHTPPAPTAWQVLTRE